MPSDLQVFVKWKEQTVFAGEDVECTITFKNVAEIAESEPSTPHPQHQRRTSRSLNADGYLPAKSSPTFFFSGNRRSVPSSPRRPALGSHRVSASLSSPLTGSHSFPPLHAPSHLNNGPNHQHKRSVSILSIESDNGGALEKTPVSTQFSRPGPWAHGRSASLQITPNRAGGLEDFLPSGGGRSPIRGNPSTESALSPRLEAEETLRASQPGPISAGKLRGTRTRPLPIPNDFKFPMSPDPASEADGDASSNGMANNDGTASRQLPKQPPSLTQQAHLAPATRILSSSSVNGSNRSSGEFYAASNNSTDTLDSEYTNYGGNRSKANMAKHRRHYSSLEPIASKKEFLTLLMGYAQVSASFTVDGSLINQSVFEEVKRKGVVGGQTTNRSKERPRRSGGLLGAFGWDAIEESISGLLSNGDLEGLRDMRGVANSNSIPLLSTPQSLLFVDLRLGPGEEKSYSFSFTLPRGLPATHKGKAIKISYNLVIGTQRPSGPKESQQVNRVNIPFRVFSGVNDQGDVLGHDLTQPYVLLRDEARVQKVSTGPRPVQKEKSISGPTWTTAPEFLSYVDELLEKHQTQNLRTPMPPKTTTLEKRHSYTAHGPHPSSCKDAIDLAILRSNQVTSTNRSANRFDIARNGRRIAEVVLNRPAHRLGETILATIDFTDAALPCFSLRATLETSEKVDPSLALRSNTSIHRATRRVYASYFENTLFSTRVVFSPAIPVSATPTLLTAGIKLDWDLRFEFVTTHSKHDADAHTSGSRLLELISQDERGSVLSALENLPSESFEIAIPLTVYGETVREPLVEENEGYSI
ncbi:hypothetical protein UA08_02964 [Talaromyces atroroseus]|uniref:Rgp1-domain-containing protein n=1 Tax=Talaromyces atroroseus TaxID=1441469 RepID=A0A225AZ09_TALAT|nr:hypothetical protein UA08_02964 [Talaromyces atroroseus]OKL62588.1 hypothetical protein UA08_02964 [Talaromyces atroroseus]